MNEITLWRFLLSVGSGRYIGVIAVYPIIPPLHGILDRVFRWAVRRGVAADILESKSDLAPINDFSDFARLRNPFPQSEKWFELNFGFSQVENELGQYSLCFKHIVCNQTKMFPLYCDVIGRVLSAADIGERGIAGLPGSIASMLKYEKKNEWLTVDQPRRIFTSLINGLVTLAIVGGSILWVISRVRFLFKDSERYFLGSDVVGDPRLSILWEEVSGAGCDVFLVYRNRHQKAELENIYPDWNLSEWPGEVFVGGRFSIRQSVEAISQCIVDIAFLYRRLSGLSSELFWHVIKLPLRRIMYRALFNRYKFTNFWGRDDYNVEHIIRTQELRRIGCRHFGVLHGQPAEPPILPQIRYIHFDVYYTFGSDWGRRFNAATWPEDMEVKGVGSFTLSRSQLMELAAERPKDIACFIKWNFQTSETLSAIVHIASSFPEKTVYLKPKSIPVGKFREIIDETLRDGPANIVETQDPSYSILLKSGISISDPSTLVAEAIQFGLVSYCLAFGDKWHTLYWRDFEGLCPSSAEEIVQKIKSIECGAESYPTPSYYELINLTGDMIWDVVLQDMGVEIEKPTTCRHLNFLREPQQLSNLTS